MPKRLGFIASLLVLVSVSSQGAHAQVTGGPVGPGGPGGGMVPPGAGGGMVNPLSASGAGAAAGGAAGLGAAGISAGALAAIGAQAVAAAPVVVGSQQTTFGAMNQFMDIMTYPSFMGSGNGVNGAGAMPYADESASSYAGRAGATMRLRC